MNDTTLSLSLACVAAFGGAGSLAAAQTFTVDADVQPRVESKRIVTDAIDDSVGTVVPDVRIFGYRFQTDPSDPYFIDAPGFDVEEDAGLPPLSTLSFSVARHLSYWSGAGPVRFSTPPNDESLRLSFGAASVTIDGSSGAQAGFAIGNIGSGGTLHRHLNASLHGGDGSTLPADGVYFTNIRLHSSDATIAPSDSIYLAYNSGASEPAFAAALSYLAEPLTGDANFDGFVNLLDFNALAANFGSTDRFWYDGDFNNDRTVSLPDFNLLAAQFGQGGSVAADVPEPPSAAAAMGWVVVLSRRRRRSR